MGRSYNEIVKENKTLQSQKEELNNVVNNLRQRVVDLEKKNRKLITDNYKLKKENEYLKSKPSTLVDNLLEFSRNFNNLAN